MAAMSVLRELVNSEPMVYTENPIQLGARGCPWKVLLASQLLQRTTRRQCEIALKRLLSALPNREDFVDVDQVEYLVRPCGLQRRRAQNLVWSALAWPTVADSRDLPGVGPYVEDALKMFCLGDRHVTCGDVALEEFARLGGPVPWARVEFTGSQSG